MKVFVLMGEIDYEGQDLIDVYRNLDDANAVLTKANDILVRGKDSGRTAQLEALADLGIHFRYDSFHVAERELL